MKKTMLCLAVLLLVGVGATAGSVDEDQEGQGAAVIAKCAAAMGGEARIRAIRTLRLEVVYPDHGDAPVVYEIHRPNQYRIESAGRYITRFDGRQASQQRVSAQGASAPLLMPAGVMGDVDLEIAWLVPAFFDYPAQYLGLADVDGRPSHRLVVTLPFGSRVTYAIDAQTNMVTMITADVTLDGKPYRFQRRWVDYRDVDGIRYPGGITYEGRDKTVQTATIRAVSLNPRLDEGRFEVTGKGR